MDCGWFLLILLIGWLVAKAIAKAVDKLLERVGFDRVVERGGINRMLAKSKYDASDVIAKLLYTPNRPLPFRSERHHMDRWPERER